MHLSEATIDEIDAFVAAEPVAGKPGKAMAPTWIGTLMGVGDWLSENLPAIVAVLNALKQLKAPPTMAEFFAKGHELYK